MTDRENLIHCFSAVFPSLSESQVVKASTSSVRDWDSVAGVTLLALIEEEFGVQLNPKDIQHLTSFDLILAYIRKSKK
jgi:acyl carrier protein